MQTISLDHLANVTGGTQQQAAPDPAAGASPEQGAVGGGFLSGLQQFLGFLQSPGFQQLISSFSGLIGQLGSGQAPASGAQQPAAQPSQPAS